MQGAARALTKDEAEAEDLIQFVFGELYGVRLDGDRRLSKLAHYAGRGSLGGWLRAVIYQAFIDRKRQNSRFEQVEEVAEFDRLANEAAAHVNGRLSAPVSQPDDIEDARLRRATEEAMTQAFAEIEPRDRLLLNYYYFDDLTLREIGLMMTRAMRRRSAAGWRRLSARSSARPKRFCSAATGCAGPRSPNVCISPRAPNSTCAAL